MAAVVVVEEGIKSVRQKSGIWHVYKSKSIPATTAAAPSLLQVCGASISTMSVVAATATAVAKNAGKIKMATKKPHQIREFVYAAAPVLLAVHDITICWSLLRASFTRNRHPRSSLQWPCIIPHSQYVCGMMMMISMVVAIIMTTTTKRSVRARQRARTFTGKIAPGHAPQKYRRKCFPAARSLVPRQIPKSWPARKWCGLKHSPICWPFRWRGNGAIV